MNAKNIIIIILVAVVAVLGTYLYMTKFSTKEISETPVSKDAQVSNFEECVAEGNPVMESYPRQCAHNGEIFVEEIDDAPVAPEEPEGEKLIGGDKDDHGCLIGAGYSWCEEKQKCLRVWEEECADKENAIISFLADKYDKDESEVTLNITREEGNYVRGGVTFAPGGIGDSGMFLATNYEGEWLVVYDGNGNPDCDKLKNTYEFPQAILEGFCD
ncbi:MAG: hypothetical protein PHH24_04065 [Candidatus Moranbacteria bacterium]|jgi:hypothetical protein|nr:hypothetical protein [Candidatus Moranbacteria bacterium]MDX9856068.1 hypothetical protein [Candidatus Moranbacteria bacterium]